MKIQFETENKELLAHLRELSDKVQPAATASALNSAGTKVRQWAVRDASKRTGVPAKILRKRIAIPRGKKATARNPSLLMFGGLWPVKVSKLTPKPRELKSGRVKYKTLPGQPMDPNAFMAPHKGGSNAVFVRKGQARLPIKNVTVNIGPAVRLGLIRALRSKDAKDYFERMFFSQMDRRVRSSLRRKGLEVS